MEDARSNGLFSSGFNRILRNSWRCELRSGPRALRLRPISANERTIARLPSGGGADSPSGLATTHLGGGKSLTAMRTISNARTRDDPRTRARASERCGREFLSTDAFFCLTSVAPEGASTASIVKFARVRYISPHSAITHGSLGLFPPPVATFSTFLITNIPSPSTRPNTTCLSSNHSVFAHVTKN